MAFDVASSLRRVRPQRSLAGTPMPREADLAWVGATPEDASQLLLDTCVVIDTLRGRTPAAVNELLVRRLCNYSTIVLAELTHLFGRLDPAHADTRHILESIGAVIAEIPAHRLGSPSVRAFGEAGMLAGLVARLRRIKPPERQAVLNDALIYCQAAENGLTVLTANVGHFALFFHLMPHGRVLFYRV